MKTLFEKMRDNRAKMEKARPTRRPTMDEMLRRLDDDIAKAALRKKQNDDWMMQKYTNAYNPH